MKRAVRAVSALILALIFLGVIAWEIEPVNAQVPTRQTTLIVDYTQYEWWMISWETNEIICRFFADHEGWPLPEDVARYCPQDLVEFWLNTPACDLSGDTSTCEGAYLFLAASQPKQREVVIDLPLPEVLVSLEECTPAPPENLCTQLPVLVLTGIEPLPEERITAIQGLFAGQPFTCDAEICRLQLQPTPLEGITIEFWAVSSYGDTSERFTAQVRVIDTGVSPAPGSSGWYVDVVSTQWTGPPIASCARIWNAFPSLGTPPDWLSTPENIAFMASDEPYFYLAGRLIAEGLVDVDECPTGGLLPNGYADACGLEKASGLVEEWQNQFDPTILSVSQNLLIPAQLIKNLFAQESQFWPGVFRVPYEFGLGQITDNGADSVLLWNKDIYTQFCPQVLSQEACDRGYLRLGPGEQAILRGAYAVQAKTDCAECPTGVDLRVAENSITLFANTLVANCAQVNQTIQTATQQRAGAVSDYENLWRFTIANYHAGPGCLAYAIHSAWQSTGTLTWDTVATQFTEPCQGVGPYVDKITR